MITWLQERASQMAQELFTSIWCGMIKREIRMIKCQITVVNYINLSVKITCPSTCPHARRALEGPATPYAEEYTEITCPRKRARRLDERP